MNRDSRQREADFPDENGRAAENDDELDEQFWPSLLETLDDEIGDQIEEA